MYFIDRENIEKLLDNMRQNIDLLTEHKSWDSLIEKRAFERLIQVMIESFIDVGNQMIDGFIMRDPGSYEDIVDILTDEGVLPKTEELDYKTVIRSRKTLVQNYLEIDHKELAKLFSQHTQAWKAFPDRVIDYLNRELGPVSAFKPTKRE